MGFFIAPHPMIPVSPRDSLLCCLGPDMIWIMCNLFAKWNDHGGCGGAMKASGYVQMILRLAMFALGLWLASFAGPVLAEDWRGWDGGDVQLFAPMRMVPPAEDSPMPEQASRDAPNWLFTLTDRPDRPDLGLTLVMAWSPTANWTGPADVLAVEQIELAGRPAWRSEWQDRDMGWRGLRYEIETVPPAGAAFVAECHAPAKLWQTAAVDCEAVIRTVTFVMPLDAMPEPEPVAGADPALMPPPPPPQPVMTQPQQVLPPPLMPVAVPGPAVAPTPDTTILFDGRETADWLPLGYAGGDFAAFARYDGRALIVDVPAGRAWANTGLQSARPVVPVPSAVADRAVQLRFQMDPAATTGALFSLLPAALAGQDHWSAHVIRLSYLEPDGQPALLMLHGRQNELGRYQVTDKSVLTDLSLWLRPDKSVVVTDAAGTVLLQGAMPGLSEDTPLTLYAEAGAPVADEAVRLRLTGIRMETPKIDLNPDATAVLRDKSETSVLFDGSLYATYFAPFWARGSDFARDARVADGALRVSVPAGSEWGKVGLYSHGPVVWLDRFHGDAEVRLGLDFDPSQTTGFAVSLYGTSTINGNDPPNPRFYLQWRRDTDGVVRAMRVYDDNVESRSADIAQGMPAHVDLVLTPAGLQVVADGFPDDILPWPLLAEGTGLRMTLYSLAAADGQPVTMALKRITLTRTPGEGGKGEDPADQSSTPTSAGQDPLPQTVFFETSPDEKWETASAGDEEFASRSDRRDTGTVLRRSDPVLNTNRIALTSKAPVADLDERLAITPCDLRIKLGPIGNFGAQIWLSDDPARYAQTAWARLSLRALQTGPDAGGLEVTLHASNFYYDHWRRVLPAGTWQKSWDGTVTVRLGPGWIAAALGDHWVVRGQAWNIMRGAKMKLAITPGGIGETDAGQLLLERISGGWVTPPGMDQTLRFSLVDDDSFDPEAFADMLAEDISEDMP